MATASITLNPMLTTNAPGLFNVNSAGYTQGDAMDDPAVKFYLNAGVVAASATSPLWGGMPISESIPSAVSQPGTNILGNTLALATATANATGICVFNQAQAGLTSPSSTTPLFGAGMSANFYRFGSNARIPLRINPALISLDGGLISQQVSWDYTNNWITTFSVTAFPVKVLNISTSGNKTVGYNAGTGAANWYSVDPSGAYVALCLI
jgi:hypothetical protein